MRIHIIHGPNLNQLGSREPETYGTMTLAEINKLIRQAGAELGVETEFFQTNHEGEIIDLLHAGGCAGFIINPGAYAHYSIAIADALAGTPQPVLEVHLSNVFAREDFRHRHVTAGRCRGYIAGLGWRGYVLALQGLVELNREGKQC